MPNIKCSVKNCKHNNNSLCALNEINVTGGECKADTCCSSFIESNGASNCNCDASPYTSVACKAHDCKHNEDCECHASNINICKCGSGCDCEATECDSYEK